MLGLCTRDQTYKYIGQPANYPNFVYPKLILHNRSHADIDNNYQLDLINAVLKTQSGHQITHRNTKL